MQRVFFYNSGTGAAAIGDASRDAFTTLQGFPNGAFAGNWTHIIELLGSGGRLLFYDAGSGAAALGQLTYSSFVTRKVYPAGAFGTWTHLLGMIEGGHASTLFYNANTGAAAVGFDPTLKTFPGGTFAAGWTHVVTGRSSLRVLFYNAATC